MRKTILKTVMLMSLTCFSFTLNVTAQCKSVAILGDSYSTFDGYNTPKTNENWYSERRNAGKNDVNNVRQMWWHRLLMENHWKLCVNNSYSGSTIAKLGYAGQDYANRSFLNRMDDLGDPDIILIFGATNDSWANVPMGDYIYENIKPKQLYDFRPAMAAMLDYITARYMSSEVYFILNDGLREEINESVKEICKHYGVPCIELQNIDKQSGHPSKEGQRQIADQVNSSINKK